MTASPSALREKVAEAIQKAGDQCFGKGMSVRDACEVLADAAIAALSSPPVAQQGWMSCDKCGAKIIEEQSE